MKSSFVFVEVKDQQAVNLLMDLRSILKGGPSRSPIHITVRGPYKNVPNREKLEDLWHAIAGEGLLLHGIGRFEFPERDVVFLKSHSKAIRRIWWKRDFPIIRFGFNPHITLYEGPSFQARAVEAFLRKEGIELYCRHLALSLYETWTDDLFQHRSRTELFGVESPPSTPLLNTYRWEPGLLERAESLMRKLRSESRGISV